MQWVQLHERKIAGFLIFLAVGIVLTLALSGTPDVALEVERGNASIPESISLTDLMEPVTCTIIESTPQGSAMNISARAGGGSGTFTWHALGGNPASGTGTTFNSVINMALPGAGLLVISGDQTSTSIPARTDSCDVPPAPYVTLSTAPTTVVGGASVQVSWNRVNFSGYPRDFVVIVPFDKGYRETLDRTWIYLNGTQIPPSSVVAGPSTVTIPVPTTPGIYRAMFYINDSIADANFMGQSNQIVVGAPTP